MTKAERILELYDGKRTTREIAVLVYGPEPTKANVAYVRVVARQRNGSGSSISDYRYRRSSLYRQTRKKLRPAIDAYNRVLRETSNRKVARAEGGRAYRAARESGLSVAESKKAYAAAYLRSHGHNGDVAAARDAYRKARRQGDRTNAGENSTHAEA